MNPFLLYLVKSTLLLAVFDAFFLLVMRHSGHFRFNRATLMAGSAVRAISDSPKWEPGTQRGHPTRVVYNFPVVFQLR